MSIPEIEIPDNLPVDEQFVQEAQTELDQVGKDLMSNKMKEMRLLEESSANGGPSSPQEAVQIGMDYCKVGIRQLAFEVGVKRTKLKKMIEGELAMPPEVLSKICSAFHKRRPDVFPA